MDEATFTKISSTILLVLTLLVLRLIHILPAASRQLQHNKLLQENKPTIKNPMELLVLLGSGGHTGEMIRILSQFKHLSCAKRNYLISSGDSTSLLNIRNFETKQKHASQDYEFEANQIILIPRARGIGDGKVIALYKTVYSFAITFFKLLKLSLSNNLPDTFLCNGPGTSIPIAYILFILKFFGLGHTKIIYVESLARVNKLSLTGMLIMPITDRFVVQWEQLTKKYRRCEYYGILV